MRECVRGPALLPLVSPAADDCNPPVHVNLGNNTRPEPPIACQAVPLLKQRGVPYRALPRADAAGDAATGAHGCKACNTAAVGACMQARRGRKAAAHRGSGGGGGGRCTHHSVKAGASAPRSLALARSPAARAPARVAAGGWCGGSLEAGGRSRNECGRERWRGRAPGGGSTQCFESERDPRITHAGVQRRDPSCKQAREEPGCNAWPKRAARAQPVGPKGGGREV